VHVINIKDLGRFALLDFSGIDLNDAHMCVIRGNWRRMTPGCNLKPPVDVMTRRVAYRTTVPVGRRLSSTGPAETN
jgi:hypothetical protein